MCQNVSACQEGMAFMYNKSMNGEFEIIVRALILNRGRILVCQIEDRDYFFLPGGHVEFGENMRKALVRELDEELGVKPKSTKFIGSVENIFDQKGKLNHEINYVFLTEIEEDEVEAQEDHLTFRWFLPHDLIEEKFAPPVLRNAVLKWLSDKKPFFILTEEEDSLEF